MSTEERNFAPSLRRADTAFPRLLLPPLPPSREATGRDQQRAAMDMGRLQQHATSSSSTSTSASSSSSSPPQPPPKKRLAGRTKFRCSAACAAGRWVCEVRVPGKRGSRLWLGTYLASEAAARTHDVAMLALGSVCLLAVPPPSALSGLDDARQAALEAAPELEQVLVKKAGIGCSEEHATELARARYEEKKLDEYRSRVGRTVQSPIVLSDEGDEDEDDTGRLSELIALAEAGLQAQEAKDDTGS
ncbi:dehydration-responsive element-binding protein 1A-like [Miscanthus floridulus]|uniref:dehydration-responsive element-binding protein 1A-like n=1 Tax=Miscanthus floridulus TaxID=154761 RepID=UPI003459FC8E